MTIGKVSTSTLSETGLIRGRKKAGTKSEKPACSDGIAATALPQVSADRQVLTKPLRPRALNPRPVWRASEGRMWKSRSAIHGGTVGKRMNIMQATNSNVAKRFMNRAHSRWLVTHSTASAMTGRMKWVK